MAMIDSSTTRMRFTVDDYYRMADCGVISPEARVELLRGEVHEMSPIGLSHSSIVSLILRTIVPICGTGALVWCQSSVRLGEHSEPEPDIAVLRPSEDDYCESHPAAGDIFLLIEVADSSLKYDKETKLPIYADHNVPEVWIVDVKQRVVEQYLDPHQGAYATCNRIGLKQRIQATQFPRINVSTGDLFPAAMQ